MDEDVVSAVTDFYAEPGPMTDLSGVDPRSLQGLPNDAFGVCGVSRHLIVHEFLADAYGLGDVSDRFNELEIRPADEIIATIIGLDPRPLVEPREAEDRMIGNCRQYTVLSSALLRRAGIPARARAGFSGYFDDTWVDHWVVEQWDSESSAWSRTDSQIDENQLQIFDIQFDPLRLPDSVFRTGSEAWRSYREGDDPHAYGIQDMRGPWFIAGNVIRDLAALNKVEVQAWDTWGVIDELAFGELSPSQIRLIDQIADTVLADDLEDIMALYRQDGLAVPGEVTSNRFQRVVSLVGVT